MKILIVGSKGFIGKHTENYFKLAGNDVWSCDVIVDYTAQNYTLIDATNADFQTTFQKHNFDICINCSGAASVPDSLKHPLRDYNLNTVNVFKLLDAIRLHCLNCKFINLSSAAVYGNPQKLPIKEITKLEPLSPYGWHKLQAEQICSEFFSFYGIATCSLRIFSAYGEGLKKQLFWDLAQKAKNGIAFQLFGTGRESRDFIHVQDVVRAIDLIIRYHKFQGNAINIANGAEITIEKVVVIFYNFWNEKINYSFSGEERKGDPNNWVADISFLQALGFESEVSLEVGLKKYFEWWSKID